MKKIVIICENIEHPRTNAVLQTAVDALTDYGFSILKISSPQTPSSGFQFLDQIKTHTKLLMRLFRVVKAGDVVYVNSLYAIAAAFVARMKKAKLICHLDADTKPKTMLDRIAKRLMPHLIDHAIFSSLYLKKQLSMNVKQQTVVYNPLQSKFDHTVNSTEPGQSTQFCVIVPMYAESEAFQGRLFKLAALIPQVKIKVLNMTETKLPLSFGTCVGTNVELVAANSKAQLYQATGLFLDLANPEEKPFSGDIELLEAMSHGLPVIVSAHGPLQELIINGKNGLALPINELSIVAASIDLLSRDNKLYQQLSDSCRSQAKLFSVADFSSAFIKPFAGQRPSPFQNLIQLFGDAYLEMNASSNLLPLNN